MSSLELEGFGLLRVAWDYFLPFLLKASFDLACTEYSITIKSEHCSALLWNSYIVCLVFFFLFYIYYIARSLFSVQLAISQTKKR